VEYEREDGGDHTWLSGERHDLGMRSCISCTSPSSTSLPAAPVIVTGRTGVPPNELSSRSSLTPAAGDQTT
jgi:hypothetical protein